MIAVLSAADRRLLPLLAGGIAIVCLLEAPSAEAQVQDFQEARTAYLEGSYQRTVDLLQPLVGGETPAMRDQILVEPARRYLGAAYVLLGRTDEARTVFEALLRAILRDDPNRFEGYSLDPATFLDQVHDVFNEVHAQIAAEVTQQQQQQQQREQAAQERRRQAQLDLLALAQEVEVEVDNDPAPTFIPFGVGQFVNGDEALGYVFLVGGGALFLGALTVGAIWLGLDLNLPTDPRTGTRVPRTPAEANALNGLVISSYAVSGAFVVFALAGIIEARLSFRPRRTVRQRREIPDEILQELELGVGPGGVTVHGRF